MKKYKVLVIDDDLAILEVLKLMLEDSGYEVELADEGKAALKLNGSKGPDLILMDILLKGEDGRIITKKIKSNPKTKHIPVILISAHIIPDESVRKSGADDFVTKPFEMNRLLESVDEHIMKSRKL